MRQGSSPKARVFRKALFFDEEANRRASDQHFQYYNSYLKDRETRAQTFRASGTSSGCRSQQQEFVRPIIVVGQFQRLLGKAIRSTPVVQKRPQQLSQEGGRRRYQFARIGEISYENKSTIRIFGVKSGITERVVAGLREVQQGLRQLKVKNVQLGRNVRLSQLEGRTQFEQLEGLL